MKIALVVTFSVGLLTTVSYAAVDFFSTFKQQSVVSKNCGQDWMLIGVKESVPKPDGNPCYIMESVPDGMLEGNKIVFVGKLGPNVEMNIGLTYKYKIVEPVSYMMALSKVARHAKARASFVPNHSVWESAKGLFIDNVVLEVASSPEVLQANGVGDTSQENFEDRVRRKANTRLSVQGIEITSVMSS